MYFIYPHLSQGIQSPTNDPSSNQCWGSTQPFGPYQVVVVQPQIPQCLQQVHNYAPTMDSTLESHLAEGFSLVDSSPEQASQIAEGLLTDVYSFSLGQETKQIQRQRQRQRQRIYELQLRALFNLGALDRMVAVFNQLYKEGIPWTDNLWLSRGKLLQAQHNNWEALTLFEFLYHKNPIQRHVFALVSVCKKIADTQGSMEEYSKYHDHCNRTFSSSNTSNSKDSRKKANSQILSEDSRKKVNSQILKVKDICEELLESWTSIMSNPSLKTKVECIITRCSGMLHQQALDQAEHEPTPTSCVVEETVSLDNDEEWPALPSAPKPLSMMSRSEAEVREPPNRVLTDICERFASYVTSEDANQWQLWPVKKMPEPLKTLIIR